MFLREKYFPFEVCLLTGLYKLNHFFSKSAGSLSLCFLKKFRICCKFDLKIKPQCCIIKWADGEREREREKLKWCTSINLKVRVKVKTIYRYFSINCENKMIKDNEIKVHLINVLHKIDLRRGKS